MPKAKWTPDPIEEATAILRTMEQQIAEALHRLRPKLIRALSRRPRKAKPSGAR